MRKLILVLCLLSTILIHSQTVSNSQITKKDAVEFIKKYFPVWCKLDPINFGSPNFASSAAALNIPSSGYLNSTKYYDTRYGVWAMDKCSFYYNNYWGYSKLFSFFNQNPSSSVYFYESSSGDKIEFYVSSDTYREKMTEYITYPSGQREVKQDSWNIRYFLSGRMIIEFSKIDSFYYTPTNDGIVNIRFTCIDKISKFPFQMKFNDIPTYGCDNSITEILNKSNTILSSLFSNPLFVLCKVDSKEHAERLVKALNFIINENKKFRQIDKF